MPLRYLFIPSTLIILLPGFDLWSISSYLMSGGEACTCSHKHTHTHPRTNITSVHSIVLSGERESGERPCLRQREEAGRRRLFPVLSLSEPRGSQDTVWPPPNTNQTLGTRAGSPQSAWIPDVLLCRTGEHWIIYMPLNWLNREMVYIDIQINTFIDRILSYSRSIIGVLSYSHSIIGNTDCMPILHSRRTNQLPSQNSS